MISQLVHRTKERASNIAIIKKGLWLILIVAFMFEMALFPSWANFMGGVVSIIATLLFYRYVFYIEFIRRYPLGFIAFLQLFCFMYLPLPVTLLDGNEMSHDLYNPILTYLLQLLYYTIAMAALLIGCKWSKRNRLVAHELQKWQYFQGPTIAQIWILTFLGWIPRLAMSQQQFGEDDAGTGTLKMFSIFVYTPLLCYFMPLMQREQVSKFQRRLVIFYVLFLVVFMISTNSRSAMISPLVMVALCYLMTLIYKPIQRYWLSVRKFLLIIVAGLVVAGPLADFGVAMLIARAERSNLTASALFSRTLDLWMDKDQLFKYKAAELALDSEKNDSTKPTVWNEWYVSNLFLNRFCNYRVADGTIYHAFRVGICNAQMQDYTLTKLWCLLPQPILDRVDGSIDKDDYNYSPMDELYWLSTGKSRVSFLVGGDVGLGLSVFGWGYFIVEFIVYVLLFCLLGNLVIWKDGRVCFSALVLLNIYSFFLLLQVAGGLSVHISYLVWSFWWVTFFQLLTYRFARFLSTFNKINR